MGRSGRKFGRSISTLSTLLPHPEQGALSGCHIWQGSAHLLPLTTLASRGRSPAASHMVIHPLTDRLTSAWLTALGQLWKKQGVKTVELCSSSEVLRAGRRLPPDWSRRPFTPLLLRPPSPLPPSLPPKYAHYILAAAGLM